MKEQNISEKQLKGKLFCTSRRIQEKAKTVRDTKLYFAPVHISSLPASVLSFSLSLVYIAWVTFETGVVLLVAVVKHAEDKRPAARQPPRLGAGSLRASDHQDAPTGPGMCPTPHGSYSKRQFHESLASHNCFR